MVLAVGLLYVLKHERVIAELPQLHDGVHERLGAAAAAAVALALGQHDALALHVPVEEPLHGRHLTLDDVLHLMASRAAVTPTRSERVNPEGGALEMSRKAAQRNILMYLYSHQYSFIHSFINSLFIEIVIE